jgi:hypothetical protein
MFANSVNLVLCLVVVGVALAVHLVPWIPDTEARLRPALVQQHQAAQLGGIALRYVVVYCIFGLSLFSFCLLLWMWGFTSVSLLLGSGASTRLAVLATPLLTLFFALLTGVLSVPAFPLLKRFQLTLLELTERLAGTAVVVSAVFAAVGVWQWGAEVVAFDGMYLLFLFLVFIISCLFMALGAAIAKQFVQK